MEELKGNSIASKNDANSNNSQTEKKITPVTSQVTVKKQNDLSKFGKKLFSEDAKSVGEYVVNDVVVPSIKKLIVDSVKNAIDYFIYGGKTSNNSSGLKNVSYQNYYTGRPSNTTSNATYTKPNIYAINDVIFNDRGEAETVLLRLKEAVERYGMVSVGDFYDCISQPSKYTDQKYGWRDLSTAQIVRTSGGFSIQFPKITPLD